MTREQRIVETFVELADTMVDEFDVVEFLHRVVERSVVLLGCEESGILLADASGALRVMASSSERAEALELLQSQNDEGPCFECFHRGAPVFSEDLTNDIGRWPKFAPAALQRGFGSVQAVPMQVRGETVGALNFFRGEVGRLAEEDIRLGRGMANIAAVALLQERSVREAHGVVAQLQGALSSRVIIEQAKGLLAERAHISVDIAFVRLRDYARQHNRRLSDIAHELIDGQIDVAGLLDLTPGARRSG